MYEEDRVVRLLEKIAKRLKRPRQRPRPVQVSFTINPGTRIITMATLPDLEVFSDQKQPMDLNPIAPGGTDVDEAIPALVSALAPDGTPSTEVGIEVVDAATNKFNLLTPNESGSAKIRIEGAAGSPAMEVVEFLFKYKPFVAGTWNPTFGAAIPDTP